MTAPGPYISDSLLITYPYSDKEVQVHDGPSFLAKYNFAVPFPNCLIVLCTKHQQMVAVGDDPHSLHDDAAKNPARWCTGCQADAPQVVLAPPPPPPDQPELTPGVGPSHYTNVDEGSEDVSPYGAMPQDAAMQEAASFLPPVQEAQPSVPYDEPEPATAAPPPEPVAPKAPKAVKPTQLPPVDLIRSVLGHYNTAKRTIEALTSQLEAAKAQAADCLTPLTAYAPSWEHEGMWYMVYMAKGIRLTLRVSDKKPGRPPKDEG